MIEIIGIGYGKDIQIGESYLQEAVVNMWDITPEDVFTYRQKGYNFTLRKVIRISEDRYSHTNLLKIDVTDEIIDSINAKHNEMTGGKKS